MVLYTENGNEYALEMQTTRNLGFLNWNTAEQRERRGGTAFVRMGFRKREREEEIYTLLCRFASRLAEPVLTRSCFSSLSADSLKTTPLHIPPVDLSPQFPGY